MRALEFITGHMIYNLAYTWILLTTTTGYSVGLRKQKYASLFPRCGQQKFCFFAMIFPGKNLSKLLTTNKWRKVWKS